MVRFENIFKEVLGDFMYTLSMREFTIVLVITNLKKYILSNITILKKKEKYFLWVKNKYMYGT